MTTTAKRRQRRRATATTRRRSRPQDHVDIDAVDRVMDMTARSLVALADTGAITPEGIDYVHQRFRKLLSALKYELKQRQSKATEMQEAHDQVAGFPEDE